MLITGFLVVFNFALVFVLISLSLKSRHRIGPLLALAVGGLIYFVAIPTEVTYFGDYSYLYGFINHSDQILILSILYFIGALIFRRLFLRDIRFKRSEPERKGRTARHNPKLEKKHVFWLVVLMIAMTIGFVILFGATFAQSQSYQDAYQGRYEDPIYSLASSIVTMVVVFIFVASREAAVNWVGWLCIFLLVTLGIVTADKNPILLGLICSAFYVSAKIRAVKLRHLAILAVLAFLFILFIPFFSAYRAGVSASAALTTGMSNISFTRMDPSGPYSSIQYVLDQGRFSYGFGYLQSLLVLIPKFILPFDRPPDPAEQYAMDVMPNWQPGMGLGFSPLAEAYNNFGYLGPFVHVMLLGLFWVVFKDVVTRILSRGPFNEVAGRFLELMGCYVFLLSFRLPLVLVLKFFILQISLLMIILFFWTSLIRFRRWR